MPEYKQRGVRAYLTAPSLAETTTRDPQRGKRPAAQRSDAAEKALRKSKTPLIEEGTRQFKLDDVPFFQVQAGRGLFNPSHHQGTIPRALALHVVLTNETFLPHAGLKEKEKPQNLMIDVLFNGILSSSTLMLMRDIVSEAKSMHQIFSGTRNDLLTERPWSILPPGHHSDGTPRASQKSISAEERWGQIGRALLDEADERGFNIRGERPPSARYLESLANMQMPAAVKTLQVPGGRKFGVIDVLVTLGNNGRKSTTYVSKPTRMPDDRFWVDAEARSEGTSGDAEGETDPEYEPDADGNYRRRSAPPAVTEVVEDTGALNNTELSPPERPSFDNRSRQADMAVSNASLVTSRGAQDVQHGKEYLQDRPRRGLPVDHYTFGPSFSFPDVQKEHVNPAELELRPNNGHLSDHAQFTPSGGASVYPSSLMEPYIPFGSPAAPPIAFPYDRLPPVLPNFPYIGPVQHEGPLPLLALFGVAKPRSQSDPGHFNPSIPHPSILISRIVISFKKKTIVDCRWATPQRVAIKPVNRGAASLKAQTNMASVHIQPKSKRRALADESPGSAGYGERKQPQRKSRRLTYQTKTPPPTSPDSVDLDVRATGAADNNGVGDLRNVFVRPTAVPTSRPTRTIGGSKRDVHDGPTTYNVPKSMSYDRYGSNRSAHGNTTRVTNPVANVPAPSGWNIKFQMSQRQRPISHVLNPQTRRQSEIGQVPEQQFTFTSPQTTPSISGLASLDDPFTDYAGSRTSMSSFDFNMSRTDFSGLSHVPLSAGRGDLTALASQQTYKNHFPSLVGLQKQTSITAQSPNAEVASRLLDKLRPIMTAPAVRSVPPELQLPSMPWQFPDDVANHTNDPVGPETPSVVTDPSVQVSNYSLEAPDIGETAELDAKSSPPEAKFEEAAVIATTNPELCQDCSICYAEVDAKDDIVLRQVKGEKEGSFTEEKVVVGFRFFIAG